MRVVSLGSGSSGNALLVEAGPEGRTKLLVDAGLGVRTLSARLHTAGVHPTQLQGVLVTHEHSDHVLGLPTLMKRYAVPVIADPRTYTAIEEGLASGAWRSDSGRLISTGNTLETGSQSTGFAVSMSTRHIDGQTGALEKPGAGETTRATVALPVGSHCKIGDVEVSSFPISHDAVAPCGYLLKADNCRVCLITDSGEVTSDMLTMMRNADLLILESNHDRDLVIKGPYPWPLKRRILSSTGHLSNDQAADAVLETWRKDAVRWLWLSHLSRTNNTPSLALNSMLARLRAVKSKTQLADLHISALPPEMGVAWNSTQVWYTPSLWDM